MNDNDLYDEFIEYNFGFSIGGIWDFVCDEYSERSYEERIDRFLFVLEKAMSSGILKLANKGVFLEGSIEEQVTKFKECFPDKEENINEYLFELNEQGDFWVPGGGVWVCEDGHEIWT